MPQALFYWRCASGKEIDFLIRRAAAELTVEVKCRQLIADHWSRKLMH